MVGSIHVTEAVQNNLQSEIKVLDQDSQIRDQNTVTVAEAKQFDQENGNTF